MTALLRAFRRAKLSIPHTQGFHPKPRVSFGPACPVGTESQAESLDLELHGTPDPDEVAGRIRRELPEGFRLLSCETADAAAESLSRTIRAIEYRVELPDGAPDVSERLAEFAARAEAAVLREREGKAPVRVDLKSAVHSLAPAGPRELRFTLRAGGTHPTARPAPLLAPLFGPEGVKPGLAPLVPGNAAFVAPARRPGALSRTPAKCAVSHAGSSQGSFDVQHLGDQRLGSGDPGSADRTGNDF